MHHNACPAVHTGPDGHGRARLRKTRSRNRNFENPRCKVRERERAILHRGDTLRVTVRWILQSDPRIGNARATCAGNSAGESLSGGLGIQWSQYLETKHQDENRRDKKKLFFPICIEGHDLPLQNRARQHEE